MAETVRRKAAKTRGYELTPAQLVARAKRFGARAARTIRPSTIVTAPWVHLKCTCGCDGYGTSRCCPPHTATADETREVIDGSRRAILFEAGRESGIDGYATARRSGFTIEVVRDEDDAARYFGVVLPD